MNLVMEVILSRQASAVIYLPPSDARANRREYANLSNSFRMLV
jgi:hypothetical protein